jgi:hypothetical protein
VNAAPMGIWTDDMNSIDLDIYKTNVTLENILRKKEFVINFPMGVDEFYKSIFKGEELEFERTEHVECFSLKDVDAFLEMRVSRTEYHGDRTRVIADVINSEVRRKPRLINRAEALALESLIAYSKLESVPEKDRAFLKEKIRENCRVTCKSAPGSVFQKRVRFLLDRIQ